MAVVEAFCLVAFGLLALWPAVYALQMYVLLWASREFDGAAAAGASEAFWSARPSSQWPRVTTQIPLYNEPAVARRVIEAAAAIDYPLHLHQIQVLDDSSDETRNIVDDTAARLRSRGVDVVVLRRRARTGFKAGALRAGMVEARGEFVAILDADFVPPPEFLKALLPRLMEDAGAACVQTRWEHLNRGQNALTRAAALGMDGHFVTEQPGRAALGLTLNFNGTAGVWRRGAIEDARVGGWEGDTLTEDLDLSYRAQMAGWRILYQLAPACPAEVPASIDSLKQQQRRWARGSIQCATKLTARVWRSDWSLGKRLAATAHLWGYSVSLAMVLMALGGRWLLAGAATDRLQPFAPAATLFVLATASAPTLACAVSARRLSGAWPAATDLVALLLLGLGMSVNNACAVLRGLWARGGEFVRTPKTGMVAGPAVPAPRDANWRLNAAELVLAAWCIWQWWWFLPVDGPVANGFLLLFAAGLLWVGMPALGGARFPAAKAVRGAGHPPGPDRVIEEGGSQVRADERSGQKTKPLRRGRATERAEIELLPGAPRVRPPS